MGKKSKIILGLAVGAMIPAMLTGCGHKHKYGTDLKSNDTQHYYECSCGKKKDAENHEELATYSHNDTHHWKDCADCGYDLTIEQHSFNQEVASSDYLKTAATATTKAVYYKSCICGKSGTETFETDKTTATITNLAISGKTYDGTAVTAPTFDKTSDATAVVEYKLKSADDNTYTTTAPIDAGQYTVRVTLPETISYTGVSATQDFTISKATTEITNLVILGKTYDGTAVTAPTFDKNSGASAVVEYKVKTADDNTYTTTAPINAGQYTVRVTVEESANYTSGSLTQDFTISKATTEITNLVILGKTYDGTAVTAPTFTNTSDATAVIEYKVKTAADNTYTTTAPINAGEYTVRVSTPETINYTAGVTTKDFTISKVTTTIENVAPLAEIVYGNDYTINYTTNSNGAVSYEWYRGSMELVDKPTNAGFNYKVKVKIAETENYTAAESELVNFVINPYLLQGYNTDVEYNGTNTHTISLGSVVSGMELVVTFDSKNVGAETTGVVVKIDGEPTNNYIVDTTTCTVNIVEKEVGLQWTEPNLRFDLTEKVPTVVATGLIGEDVCEVVKNLFGDNVWYGSTFTYEATDLTNPNYKLPSNKVSPEYTITIDELVVGDEGAHVADGTYYQNISIETEGWYYFDFVPSTQGVEVTFELYAKEDKTQADPIIEFVVGDQNKQSNAFYLEVGNYFVKSITDDQPQYDIIKVVVDEHTTADKYGFCDKGCGTYLGNDEFVTNCWETETMSSGDVKYYRFADAGDVQYNIKYYESDGDGLTIKCYRTDNEGNFEEVALSETASEFIGSFDGYYYLVIKYYNALGNDKAFTFQIEQQTNS